MPYQINIATSTDKKEIFLLRSMNYSRMSVYEEEFVGSLEKEDIMDVKYNSVYIIAKEKKSGIMIGSIRVTNLIKSNAPLELELIENIPWSRFTFVDRLNIRPGFDSASLHLMVSAWAYAEKSTGAMVALAIKPLCRLYKISAGLNYLSTHPFSRPQDLKEPVYLIGGATAEILDRVKRNKLNISGIVDKLLLKGKENE